MKADLILFSKARGWWSPQHGGTHVKRARAGEDGGSAGVVASSAEIKTLADAKAYWKRNFEDPGPQDLTVKYRKKNYQIVVKFERNHAYTKIGGGSRGDVDRVFDPERAVLMDHIWDVLARPNAINPSPRGDGKKQYDKQISVSGLLGRVILAPQLDMRDAQTGELRHFRFVSWHPINATQYAAALKAAERRLEKPVDMKKALPFSRALTITEPFSPLELGASPASEGVAFNHYRASRPLRNRKSHDSDGRADRTSKDSAMQKHVKARVLFFAHNV